MLRLNLRRLKSSNRITRKKGIDRLRWVRKPKATQALKAPLGNFDYQRLMCVL